jgi:hypothetical protein
MNTLKKSVALAGLVAFGMAVSTAGAAVLGPNLITNGDMELGNPPTFWDPYPAGTSVSASSDTPDGSLQSLAIQAPAANESALHDYIPIPAGDRTFQLEFDHKNADQMYFGLYSNNGDPTLYADYRPTSSGWSHYSIQFDIPASTTSAFLRLFPVDQTQTIYVDNVSLRQVEVPEPASALLMGIGAMSLGLRRRRRQ